MSTTLEPADTLVRPGAVDGADVRTEIELKFAFPRARLADLSRGGGSTKDIYQVYLTIPCLDPVLKILPENYASYSEWRIRKYGSDHFVTGKKTIQGISRRTEFETSISEENFRSVLEKARGAGAISSVRKRRTEIPLRTYRWDPKATMVIDDYAEVAGIAPTLDFVVVEIEVRDPRVLNALREGPGLVGLLEPLRAAIEISDIPGFSNKELAQRGFPVASFAEVKELAGRSLGERFDRLLVSGGTGLDLPELGRAIRRLETTSVAALDSADGEQDGLGQYRGALSSFRFTIRDSGGREIPLEPELVGRDRAGQGWIRDYHVVISANPFIRLFSKPQIFRPGRGYSNTTTRGAHTQDVAAASMFLARHLGLNVDLCAAMAAMHDLGHPAGGHVGEEVIFELSQRRFHHQYFSVSLVQLFGLNLLREVQDGAWHHKTSGRPLVAAPSLPQEYGVVMVADKIAYAAWDIFDSINNGFLQRDHLDRNLFKVLGQGPQQWLDAMLSAVIRESAEFLNVQFTEHSGEIFAAYKSIRSLIQEHVHPQIVWHRLKASMTMCYEAFASSFPDIDTPAIIAYMTDYELETVASMIEERPQMTRLTRDEFEARRLGFVEFMDILGGDAGKGVNYSSIPTFPDWQIETR